MNDFIQKFLHTYKKGAMDNFIKRIEYSIIFH